VSSEASSSGVVSMSGIVGVLANPASGKDVRRLVAYASPTSDAAKIGIVRRAILGAIGGGAKQVLVAPDSHQIAQRAMADLELNTSVGPLAAVELLDEAVFGTRDDTKAMARRFASEDVSALIVLGGDGTIRDVAMGWEAAPLVALSTGTNNVFPRFVDATVAGMAAGLFAIGVDRSGYQAKVIRVSFSDGRADTLALVDLALTDSPFVGSRAVWEVSSLRGVIACIAEPECIGLSAIAAMLHPCQRRAPGGVVVDLGLGGEMVTAIVAPGIVAVVPFRSVRHVKFDEPILISGPMVLAFDGERDCDLPDGTTATVSIVPDGPFVIDPELVVRNAVAAGWFIRKRDTRGN
jgi:predicted polyphosphate/ATP-dependent NAD kinase